MSDIVSTVTGRTMSELRRARDAAAGADLVELRLDTVDVPDARAALEGRLRPAIVTCRPRWEGGAFDGAEEERRRILVDAIAAGAEFVDVELRAGFVADIVRMRRGRGVVVSSHVFTADGTSPASRLEALRATGAEVAKLAITVDSLTETLPLFDLAARQDEQARTEGGDHVLIAMGPRGVHSRILAARLGNRWTYAGDGVAPGQLPAARMTTEYHVRRITASTAVYGVTGDPVGGSLSPAMHNAGFEHFGMDAVYVPLEARDVEDFVTFARAMDLRGASVTAPFKVEMMRHVAECEPLAAAVGALNTIINSGGRWIGGNTDVHGFVTPLKGRIALKGIRATVLGAGGAARAVAVALKREGAAVTISARRREQARRVAEAIGVRSGPFPPRPGSWDVLVNATSAGRHPGDESPMTGVRLDGEIVFDLIYTPADTPLILQARAEGCLTIGGIEMLIAQAERQFVKWTGSAPPPGLFGEAAGAAMRCRTGAAS